MKSNSLARATPVFAGQARSYENYCWAHRQLWIVSCRS